ncbi:DUF3800 domain-containing protein [uncultured Lacinutrix sp.]|uniref:DUF3800 domain-containing protein n=1 Tax=uncultured Lacinutrix sp. TaxID=574032 RepID=UPI00260B5091|nr:DUF3800 domain-containing protein [uncultured Lacinutrix sp.]
MSEKVFIYGDEFGTSHLDINIQGNISHFIYASLIIQEKDLKQAYKIRKHLSDKYFSGGKLKSNSRGMKDKNFDKRLEILSYIVDNLDFKINTIVADKSLIKSKGLEFKEVFYKYFQSMLVHNIITEYERFEVYAHRIISDSFAKEMYIYLDNKLNTNTLFSSYKMVDDKDEVLVQLSDVIVGSLGRVFTHSHYHSRSNEIMDILHLKMNTPTFFPYKINNHLKSSAADFNVDNDINQMVINDVVNYVENDTNSKEKKDLLKYLLFMNKVSPFKMNEIYEIVSKMNFLHNNITKDNVRSMIKDLRYDGILVISASGKSGYKLACNETDVVNYFSHYFKYVEPMLAKIEVADKKIKESKGSEYSLLDNPKFNLLKHLMTIYNKY